MNERIISRFDALSFGDIDIIADAIKHNDFYIEINEGTPIPPTGLLKGVFLKKFYRNVLDDKKATFYNYFFCFKIGENDVLKLSMGIYGTSKINKLRFPFIIGNILMDFLKLDPKGATSLLGIDEETSMNGSWNSFHQAKITLLNAIFEFFGNLDDGICTAMAWTARPQGSLTRSTLESIDAYKRVEDADNKVEYYYTFKQADENTFDYIKGCASRWGKANESKKDAAVNKTQVEVEDVQKNRKLLAHFCCNLLELNCATLNN
jgi:hypothetical protein